MLSQSEFNRRARNLMKVMAELFHYLVEKVNVRLDPHRIVDSAPIHVRHYKRSGLHHLALEGAEIGCCAAKAEYFYGYRLVLLITPSGIIADYLLVPGDADEHPGAGTLRGLCTRLHTKLSAFLFAVWFNIRTGRPATAIDGLTL